MNRIWKSAFSVLLAIALLLPMAPVVRAEGGEGESESASVSAERVELSTNVSGNQIYYRSGYAGEITVTATVFPSTYTGKIQWELSEDARLKVLSKDETVSGGQAKITLQAMQPVSNLDVPTLTAAVDTAATTSKIKSAPLVIKVAKDTVNTSQINFTQTSATVQIGKTVQLSLNTKPVYPSGNGTPPLVYESSAPAFATVDENGLVKGLREGGATIIAKVDNVQLGTSVNVSVVPLSSSLTGEATLGVKFSMQDIYDSLLSQFSSTYGVKPTKVTFPALNKANGTLCSKGGTPIVANDPYDFSQLHDMYVDPTNAGTFSFKATVTDGTNSITGNIAITIVVPTKAIRIPLTGSTNYSFNQVSEDNSGRTGAQLIRDALGTFGSISFDSVSTESSKVGTLYTSSFANSDNRVSNGTVVTASDIDDLYFTPSRAGTYTVSFSTYSGSSGYGTVISKGELIIPVDGTSLDLSINLSKVEPYTFANSPSSGSNSLYALLLSAINGSVGGSNWGGIKFDGIASASTCGTLHQSSAHARAISADDYIAKSSISQLYYVPDRAGTYEVVYGIYGTAESTKPIANGKLTIVCSTIPTGVSDITYTVSTKGSVSFKETDFIDFFQKENGNRYELSYVVFTEYLGDGTFYHDSQSFVPYNSADFYASTYSGTLPSNPHYLDRIKFTAPEKSGVTAVTFTCYGTAGSTTKQTSGKLCIFYTANTVPALTYNASDVASIDLKEADFVAAYNAAMNTSIAKPSFNIQLLTAPNKGLLYYYYGGGNTRRNLTSTNISDYTFAVNGSSHDTVEYVSYSANKSSFGTDTITYVASSTSGTLLYVGEIQFKLSSDVSINITNDGSNFQLSDFYTSNESDPVLYITFPKPSAGVVYAYDGNRYVAATAATKFYTVSPGDGQYALTSAFYAPKANDTNPITLKYVAHRKSGITSSNSMTLNVLSKTSSATFGDVAGVTGWASNSIDFASKMGLVKGTSTNPPKFSPSNTMRRCDFVLMLYRLAGSPTVSGATFSDVTSDKYYYDSAVWAFRNNIMRNVTINGLYNPEGAMTRQDFAQILYNYANAIGEDTSNTGSIRAYADASSVSSNTLEGVTWAVAKGYITSAVAGQLYIEPTRAATRAEISTLLHRYLTY